MIKYEGFKNEYHFDMNIVDTILSEITPGSEKFLFSDDYTRERVITVLKHINDFIEGIQIEKTPAIMERKETEEEAREYFGQDFINNFNNLLTELDRQETIVFLHGTNVDICPSICEQGLMYKNPDLRATAVEQEMSYGTGNIKYDRFEQLLNWPHKGYKGLAIIAVPYECFYKEGLWNQFQRSDANFAGIQDFKIDSDFIVGFIDIERKQIIINPKYNRQHNYTGYIRDNELFHEQKNINNDIFVQRIKESVQLFKKNNKEDAVSDDNGKVYNFNSFDISGYIEEFRGIFNAIKHGGIRAGTPGKMNEEAYGINMAEINENLRYIQLLLPHLKTEEQQKKEKEESLTEQSISVVASDDFDWGEWPEWVPEENGKTR